MLSLGILCIQYVVQESEQTFEKSVIPETCSNFGFSGHFADQSLIIL